MLSQSAPAGLYKNTWDFDGVTILNLRGEWSCPKGVNYFAPGPAFPTAACASMLSADGKSGWLATSAPPEDQIATLTAAAPTGPPAWLSDYPALAKCEWGIPAAAGSTVKITVVQMDTEETNDVISISQGITPEARTVSTPGLTTTPPPTTTADNTASEDTADGDNSDYGSAKRKLLQTAAGTSDAPVNEGPYPSGTQTPEIPVEPPALLLSGKASATIKPILVPAVQSKCKECAHVAGNAQPLAELMTTCAGGAIVRHCVPMPTRMA
jgi:hypothetical protein